MDKQGERRRGEERRMGSMDDVQYEHGNSCKSRSMNVGSVNKQNGMKEKAERKNKIKFLLPPQTPLHFKRSDIKRP